MNVQSEHDKASKREKMSRDKLHQSDSERKQLANEYIQLKANYAALSDENQSEVSRNEELCMELLNLVNAKTILVKQLANIHDSGHALGLDADVERIRNLVQRLSTRKFKVLFLFNFSVRAYGLMVNKCFSPKTCYDQRRIV